MTGRTDLLIGIGGMSGTTTEGLSLRVRLVMRETWIPTSAGMTKSGSGDVWDNHGGIVPTIAVDDCNMDSRSPFGAGDKLRGNDEMRVG